MHTDFVESMAPWHADEPDTDPQSGGQGAKNPETRKNPATPPPPKTPPK